VDFHLFPDSPHARVFPAPRRGLFYFLKQGTSLIFLLGKVFSIIAASQVGGVDSVKGKCYEQ